jgi:hypothetical protein
MNVYIVLLNISEEDEQSYEYDYEYGDPIRFRTKRIGEFLDLATAQNFACQFERNMGIDDSMEHYLSIHECNIKFRDSFYNRFLRKESLRRA